MRNFFNYLNRYKQAQVWIEIQKEREDKKQADMDKVDLGVLIEEENDDQLVVVPAVI